MFQSLLSIKTIGQDDPLWSHPNQVILWFWESEKIKCSWLAHLLSGLWSLSSEGKLEWNREQPVQGASNPHVSCPAATQTSWCGTRAQWSTIQRQCWTPGGRKWSLMLCCQPLLGSPPELCLPHGTKKLMSLGTPDNSLCVLGWFALGEHTPANTLLQVANRTGKWISTRKQKPPDNKLWLKWNSLYAKPCDIQNQPNCPSFWSLPGIISTPPGENPPPVFCFQLAPIHSCSKCPTGFF